MTFRRIIHKMHLWLGLASGLLVFIIAITGCCWVFKEEIQSLLREEIVIGAQTRPVITPSEAKRAALGVFPERELHGVLYGDRDRPLEVIFYQPEPLFYSSVFLEPYTGQVLDIEDHLSGFFAFVLDGHLNLWLPEEIGNQVVRWACVVFAVMLFSGIVLWWPRKRSSRKQRLAFQWKQTTRWRRKNYDLHSILGFYSSILGFVLVFTGLIMAFPVVKDAVYYGLGGDKEATFIVPNGFAKNPSRDSHSIDSLLPRLQKEFPNARDFEIHYPHSDSAAIYVEVSRTDGVFYNSDFLYFDQYTLEEIPSSTFYGRYDEATMPDFLLRMNYDTHIGAILGLPGKILVFFASLIVASLPVTGFALWYGRRQKSRRPRPSHKILSTISRRRVEAATGIESE